MSDEERTERRERWLREGAAPPRRRDEVRRRSDELSGRDAAEIREALQDLRPAQRQRLRRALENWDELTPAQQRKVSRHLARLRDVSEERRSRMERNRERWEGLDRRHRDRMRQRLHRFRKLPPDAQAALVEKRFGNRSVEERARILERLRRGEPAR